MTFKAAAKDQRIGTKTFAKYQPIFTIDTAKTSEMSQESTTVYADGGRGNNHLIAWEGEKQMSFKVTDALISPMGLAVLSGAGLFDASSSKIIHNHITMTKTAAASGSDYGVTVTYDELAEELGINDESPIFVCADTNNGLVYATIVDETGYGYAWLEKPLTPSGSAPSSGDPADTIKVAKNGSVLFKITDATDKTAATGKTLMVDFYVAMKSGASEIVIEPDSFGGYFYVEADTLFRKEKDGQDMAATLTFPRVKVQSAFTFSMASSGDPSTFDFNMDAFPGPTQFDSTKKVCVVMDFIGSDSPQGTANAVVHSDHKVTT